MRAGKEVAHDSGVLALSAEMVPDPDDPGRFFGSSARKINRGQACRVGLRRTGARNHGSHSGSDHSEWSKQSHSDHI
jgi:hypothetical protein